ncbi:MAG: hypothetical protein QOK03_3374 [Candidatus Binataceae bacterium]|nr:hypothetical protein [Candidatus Binataceae bacterium]
MDGGPESTGVAFELGRCAFLEDLATGGAAVVGAGVPAEVAEVAGETAGVAAAFGVVVDGGVGDGASDGLGETPDGAAAGRVDACVEEGAG